MRITIFVICFSTVTSTDKFPIMTVEQALTSDADIDIIVSELVSEEFDAEFDNIIRSVDELQNETVDLPDDLNLDAVLETNKYKHVVTTM